jgi:hypothetical protein
MEFAQLYLSNILFLRPVELKISSWGLHDFLPLGSSISWGIPCIISIVPDIQKHVRPLLHLVGVTSCVSSLGNHCLCISVLFKFMVRMKPRLLGVGAFFQLLVGGERGYVASVFLRKPTGRMQTSCSSGSAFFLTTPLPSCFVPGRQLHCLGISGKLFTSLEFHFICMYN